MVEKVRDTLRYAGRARSSTREKRVTQRLSTIADNLDVPVSFLQRVTTSPRSWVVRLAMEITSSRSEGGKASRSTRPRSILRARQAVSEVAASPDGNRAAIASKFGGDLEVGGMVGGGRPEHQAASEGEGLGCGPGSEEGFQAITFGLGQGDFRR